MKAIDILRGLGFRLSEKRQPTPFRHEHESFSLSHILQGDVITGMSFPVLIGKENLAWTVEAEGVVVLSQTCDLVRTESATVAVAPLIRLPKSDVGNASSGRMPRYVHVPSAGTDAFADLDYLLTMDKRMFVDLAPIHSLRTDKERRRFGQEVGRRSSRFAFPDDVVPWFTPLRSVAQTKALKQASPEGQAFGKVEELRVQSLNGWSTPPYDLLLSILVEPGELPVFPGDDLPDLPRELARKIRPGESLAPAGVLAGLLSKAIDPVSKYFLWNALGEAWGDRCTPDLAGVKDVGRRSAISSAVLGERVASEVLSSDEYSLARMLRSERLDLAHLSSPSPR